MAKTCLDCETKFNEPLDFIEVMFHKCLPTEEECPCFFGATCPSSNKHRKES